MKWLIPSLVFFIVFPLSLQAQSFAPAFSLLDSIDAQLTELQNSNEELLNQNEELKSSLNNITKDFQVLKPIMNEQNQLLTQWESSWNEMMELYRVQEKRSRTYGIVLKICVPVTTAAITGLLVWGMTK